MSGLRRLFGCLSVCHYSPILKILTQSRRPQPPIPPISIVGNRLTVAVPAMASIQLRPISSVRRTLPVTCRAHLKRAYCDMHHSLCWNSDSPSKPAQFLEIEAHRSPSPCTMNNQVIQMPCPARPRHIISLTRISASCS